MGAYAGDRAVLGVAAAGPSAKRYLKAVFDEVEVTHGVVYRHAVDAHGNPVQLTLDVYEPAGDTASERPAVVWMHGGWFSDGDKADMADYAEAFARAEGAPPGAPSGLVP
jgi:acetyl esterase/lipase